MLKTYLPSKAEIDQQYPISSNAQKLIKQFRIEAKNIFNATDPRIVVFLGPCSIHDENQINNYSALVSKLNKEVSSKIFIALRVFLEKPRSIYGWKGYLQDPSLNFQYNILEGIQKSRRILSEITKKKIPVVTEFLNPILASYTKDYITWGVIGSRTSTSQIHREFASNQDMPIGFKNPLDGSFDDAINSSLSSRTPQSTIEYDPLNKPYLTTSPGNNYTHVILRGGYSGTNYHKKDISRLLECQKRRKLRARVVVDCSHGNITRNTFDQVSVFKNIIEQIKEGNKEIMGIMIESHIKKNNQCSITDPCIDWQTSLELIKTAHKKL